MPNLICGGPSSPKNGVASVVLVASGYLIQLLEASGYAWLAAIAPFVPLVSLNLNTFCSSDPPALPTLTSSEATALLNLDILNTDFSTGLTKVEQIVQNRAWFELCQCDTQVFPTPPAAQAAPANTPTWYGTQPVRCTSFTQTGSDLAGAADGLFHGPQLNATWGLFRRLDNNQLFSGTPTQVDVQLFVQTGQGTTPDYTFRVQFSSDANGNVPISHVDQFVAAGGFIELVLNVPSNAASIQILTSHTAAGNANPNSAVALMCAGTQAGGYPNPCCSPDTQLITSLQQLRSTVDLIQRQAVPFAYIRSTAHAALTGSGELAVSDLIGCIVQMTTIPQNVGLEAGDPTEYFEAGWINWGNADGFAGRERLTVSPQVSFPAAAGQFTRIGYTLRPNVVVTITELIREP